LINLHQNNKREKLYHLKIAIFSDIHEDIVSLELALQKAKKHGCETIVCLGDISGYNPRFHNFIDHRNASACLQLLLENQAVLIAGNHDLHACKKIPDTKALSKLPENWYDLDYQTRHQLGAEKYWLYPDELDPLYRAKDIAVLEKATSYYICKEGANHFLFSHYLYPNLSGFTTHFYEEVNAIQPHLNFMTEKQCCISFCGHTHLPGLSVTRNTARFYGFNKKATLAANSIVMVPPIVRSRAANGFCIFNAKDFTTVAIRI